MTAVSVKARLKLVDANGNDVINKVVTVAPSIFPGRTVWVAPMVTGNSSHPWTWELSDTSGKAVSGTATVLKVKWAKKKSARTPTVDADFSTTASKSCVTTTCRDYNQKASLRYRDLNFSGIIPNPSKAYNAYITRVFFADDGTPLAGYRTWETINKGANPRAYVTALPTNLASRVGGVTYFVSR